MSYSYSIQKHELFTECGMETYIKIRDNTLALINSAGAVMLQNAISVATGDTWTMIAAMDYMVEKKLIREIPQGNVAGQYRIFVKANQ